MTETNTKKIENMEKACSQKIFLEMIFNDNIYLMMKTLEIAILKTKTSLINFDKKKESTGQ